jgi:hypothetical protein
MGFENFDKRDRTRLEKFYGTAAIFTRYHYSTQKPEQNQTIPLSLALSHTLSRILTP